MIMVQGASSVRLRKLGKMKGSARAERLDRD